LLSVITEFPLPAGQYSSDSLTAGPDGNLWFSDSNGIGRITPAGAITEFPLPAGQHSSGGLTVGPDGNLWFFEYTETGSSAIGRITPAGAISEFPLPALTVTPSDLAVGPDGNLWFSDSYPDSSEIVRITPAGAITEFPLPAGQYSSGGLMVGPDGNLWFPESYVEVAGGLCGPGCGGYFVLIFDKIGRMTLTGSITQFPLPAVNGPSMEPSLTVGPDGNLWFPDSNGIGRITPAGDITEFPLPAGLGYPGGLTVGPDGNLWFPDSNGIGRITPAGAITEFPLPAGHGSPGGLTVGPDGNLWFFEYTETGSSAIGRIMPAGGLTEFPLPTPVQYAGGLTVGPDGNLWFSDTAGRIGRVDLGPRVTKVIAVAHSRKAITSILLSFNETLDPASAANVGTYSLASGVERKHKLVFRKAVRIARVSYDDAAQTVRLKLAIPQKGPIQVTVRAGIVGADGVSSYSDYTEVIK
jgi:streptogramin lyase